MGLLIGEGDWGRRKQAKGTEGNLGSGVGGPGLPQGCGIGVAPSLISSPSDWGPRAGVFLRTRMPKDRGHLGS